MAGASPALWKSWSENEWRQKASSPVRRSASPIPSFYRFMSQYTSPFSSSRLLSFALQIIQANTSFIWNHIVIEKICSALFSLSLG